MIDIVRRSDLPADAWDDFCLGHHGAWFWHTERWIAYALAYASRSVDYSVAAVEDGRVVGVAPYVLIDGRLTHGGQPSPVALASIATEDAGKGPSSLLAMFRRLPQATGTVAGPNALEPIVDGPGTYVLDLATGGGKWLGIRRSYHSLINRAAHLYDVRACAPSAAFPVMAQARAIHAEAAGRITRSAETWDMMAQWIVDGFGVLVVARDRVSHFPLGFAYAIRYRDHAYWASGATLVPDLQAALQWEVIRVLQRDGRTRTYELGYDADDDATAKEKSVAHFKAGFGRRQSRSLFTLPAALPAGGDE